MIIPGHGFGSIDLNTEWTVVRQKLGPDFKVGSDADGRLLYIYGKRGFAFVIDNHGLVEKIIVNRTGVGDDTYQMRCGAKVGSSIKLVVNAFDRPDSSNGHVHIWNCGLAVITANSSGEIKSLAVIRSR